MSIRPEIRDALLQGRDQIWARHGKDPNFTGCGIGYRRRGGTVTYEPVVIAMVVDKLPAGALSSRRLIPSAVTVNGTDYGVDVVEAGPVYASGRYPDVSPRSVSTSSPVTGPFRPLLQGCGISNADLTVPSSSPVSKNSPAPAGTLGCFAQDASGAVYLVSAGHILAAGVNQWSAGSTTDPGHITQPALVDQGLTGTEYNTPVAITTYVNTLDTTPGSMNNTVDCGAAKIDPTVTSAGVGFANGDMPPIDATHPAVGMCVAGDSSGNSFLADMAATLSNLNLSLLGMTSPSDGTTTAQVGMHIEKVGRTSGYTSSTVDATDAIVNVYFIDCVLNAFVQVTMSGMIWSQWLTMRGDSGAIACQGGDGQTYVLPPRAPCHLTSSVQTYYALPANLSDNNLTNNFQAKVLTQTPTGNLLIGLIYLNQQTFIDRLSTMTGPAYNQATAQALFQQLYDTYRPVIVSVLTSPQSFVLTPQMGTDATTAYHMLADSPADGGQGILTRDESIIIDGLLGNFTAWCSRGYTYQQCQNKLANPWMYEVLWEWLPYTPTIIAP